MKQSFKTRVRQWWVPAEFRLSEPEFTRDQLDLLEELIQLIAPNISRAESATRDGRLQMANFLVDLGTGIWRIRRKIEGLSRMPREIRDAMYSLESMWMSMSEGGVEIVDHMGTIPSAREAKIIETRNVPGLAREQVIETIKPTILLRGELVQLGEVIMGKPASPTGVAQIQERPDNVTEEPEQEEIQPRALKVETFTMEPPLKKWEPPDMSKPLKTAPFEAEKPAEFVEASSPAEVALISDNVSDEGPVSEETAGIREPAAVIAAYEDDEPRLDSETARAMEAMASSGGTGPAGVVPNEPHAAAADGETRTDEPEIEIPLPRRAPRKGKSVREAVKQVIREEPVATAFDDTGRARRRKMRSATVKQDIPPEPGPTATVPRKKPTAKKKSREEEA